MGCRARVMAVSAASGTVEAAVRRLWELERRWSRFISSSETNQLATGHPTIVSEETYLLIATGIDAWRLTDGRYDPTVAEAVVAAGYDRSFDEMPPTATAAAVTGPAPGCAGIELDPTTMAVSLPPGTRFDPGAIGKGLAADLVVAEMIEAGAAGALVEIGGDLRVAGRSPRDGGWNIAIEDPHDPRRSIRELRLGEGAVATTSRVARAWHRRDGTYAHHVIDPATGSPSDSDVVAVTVVAASGWSAEVFATAAFVSGATAGIRILEEHGLAGIAVTASGSKIATGMERFE